MSFLFVDTEATPPPTLKISKLSETQKITQNTLNDIQELREALKKAEVNLEKKSAELSKCKNDKLTVTVDREEFIPEAFA